MEVTLTKWLETFTKDSFKYGNNKYYLRALLIDCGWYDWFSGLKSRAEFTKKCTNMLIKIKDSNLFDRDKCYIFFTESIDCGTNNVIQSVKICDIDTEEVLYCISYIKSLGWQVWDFASGTDYASKENTWHNLAIENKTLREVYKFFNN